MIYLEHAGEYDRLVMREDYRGNLLGELIRVAGKPLADVDAVEMGAGTGRLTRLLAPRVKSIAAFDRSPSMLAVARDHLASSRLKSWRIAIGDNRRLPAAGRCADLVIAGWSLGHAQHWYPDSWRRETALAVDEMRRVVRPGGRLIIVETLGTGYETPRPPHAGLAAYYAYLEAEYGFTRSWIRTDYRFESIEEADTSIRFFFGDELADRIVRDKLLILPECTGFWTLTG